MLQRLLTLGVFLIATSVRAEDWPGWLGPRRDGSSSEKVAPWKGDLKVVWRKPVGEGHSSPIVAGGKVFLHTKVKGKHVERVDAFDAATGEIVWTKEYDYTPFTSPYGNGPRGTPSLVDGKLYTFGITGVLTCLDAKKGDIAWQVDTLKKYDAKNLFFGTSCSPLIDSGRAYVAVGGKGASLVAFEKETGKPVWQSLDDKASYSSPIILTQGDKKQLVCLTAANLLAVDPHDGKKIWAYPFKDALFESSTTPIRVGNLLVGSSITVGGVGLKLQGDTFEKVWAEPKLTCYFSTPIAADGDLYLVTGTNPIAFTKTKKATLHCVDPATGKERWMRDKVGTYHASLTRTGDGKLLLIEEDGTLALVEPNPKEYRELARSKICGTTWAHPAIANGRLLIRDHNDLVCVELPKQ